jgi:hypothetical protein
MKLFNQTAITKRELEIDINFQLGVAFKPSLSVNNSLGSLLKSSLRLINRVGVSVVRGQ